MGAYGTGVTQHKKCIHHRNEQNYSTNSTAAQKRNIAISVREIDKQN